MDAAGAPVEAAEDTARDSAAAAEDAEDAAEDAAAAAAASAADDDPLWALPPELLLRVLAALAVPDPSPVAAAHALLALAATARRYHRLVCRSRAGDRALWRRVCALEWGIPLRMLRGVAIAGDPPLAGISVSGPALGGGGGADMWSWQRVVRSMTPGRIVRARPRGFHTADPQCSPLIRIGAHGRWARFCGPLGGNQAVLADGCFAAPEAPRGADVAPPAYVIPQRLWDGTFVAVRCSLAYYEIRIHACPAAAPDDGDAAAAAGAAAAGAREEPLSEKRSRHPPRPSCIAIGWTINPAFPRMSALPGWLPGSVGFHSDDGGLFDRGYTSTYAPVFGPGDVVGTGFDFQTRTAYFSLNGRWVGSIRLRLGFPATEPTRLCPVVGLDSPDIVEPNFGDRPFLPVEDGALPPAMLREHTLRTNASASTRVHPGVPLPAPYSGLTGLISPADLEILANLEGVVDPHIHATAVLALLLGEEDLLPSILPHPPGLGEVSSGSDYFASDYEGEYSLTASTADHSDMDDGDANDGDMDSDMDYYDDGDDGDGDGDGDGGDNGDDGGDDDLLTVAGDGDVGEGDHTHDGGCFAGS